MKFNDYLKELRSRRFPDTNKITKLLKFREESLEKNREWNQSATTKACTKKFCILVNCKIYEQNQLFALAKKWKPSPLTNTMNNILTPSVELMKHYKPDEYKLWYEAAIQENTPDYQHKYWGI